MDDTFRWRSRRCEFGRFGGQSEVEEDLLQDRPVGEEPKKSAGGAAVGAGQGVEQKNPFQQFSPEVVPTPA